MPVTILTSAHVLAYKTLMLHAYEHAADSFASTPEEGVEQTDVWWAERVVHPHGMCLAFGEFEGDRLVGTVGLEFSHRTKLSHKALVVSLYVHPAARGKGYARALMQGAIRFCQDWQSIRAVQLQVTETNAPAVALYQSLGFETYGVEPLAILTPTGLQSTRLMWLHLPGDAAITAACGK